MRVNGLPNSIVLAQVCVPQSAIRHPLGESGSQTIDFTSIEGILFVCTACTLPVSLGQVDLLCTPSLTVPCCLLRICASRSYAVSNSFPIPGRIHERAYSHRDCSMPRCGANRQSWGPPRLCQPCEYPSLKSVGTVRGFVKRVMGFLGLTLATNGGLCPLRLTIPEFPATTLAALRPNL